jgi:hypothetical protein
MMQSLSQGRGKFQRRHFRLFDFLSNIRLHALLSAALITAAPGITRAQDHGAHGDSSVSVMLGAHAIGMITHQSPAVAGESMTEGYLTQPTLMAHAGGRGMPTLQLMLSLEGLTLERGELNPGIVGEGYIDRRHPHTYLHELTATLERGRDRARGSVTIGKGFAPFGTDDPMVRPFVKYPINHHLAQILERVVAIGALRIGPIGLEAGSFNGDEPESSGDAPNRSRLWDSWAMRATVFPIDGGEVQASYADVRSPEIAKGGGPDDRKWSVSGRFENVGRKQYALAEWARSTGYVGSDKTLDFHSFLIEGQTGVSRLLLAGRLEVTDRADEERLSDPFRTLAGGHDFSILGRSRWTIGTIAVAFPIAMRRGVSLTPFAEVAQHGVRETLRPSGFVPADFYGSDRILVLSGGLRIGIGAMHGRMGRYGAAIPRQRGTTPSANPSPQHAH